MAILNRPRTTEVTQAELESLEACRRAMRSRLLTQWGEETHAEIAAKHFSNPDLIGNGKKLRWHSTFGSIAIHQQVFRAKADGKPRRPFLAQAKVTDCGCSLLLRSRLVDFSSERSMEGAAPALREHYGISLSASVINKVTRGTGLAAKAFNAEVAAPAKSADLIVVQIDGSMVSIARVWRGQCGAKNGGHETQARVPLERVQAMVFISDGPGDLGESFPGKSAARCGRLGETVPA